MKKYLIGSSISPDLAALILRVGAGAAMLTHGWPKLHGFTDRMHSFGDPYGLGSPLSLGLAVFAEFFCSVFVILGLYTRAAVIPLIITMGTVIFRVHWMDPFGKKELPLLYLIAFLAIFFLGSGKYSVDGKG